MPCILQGIFVFLKGGPERPGFQEYLTYMKQRFVNILRSAGLIYLADYGRFLLMRIRHSKANNAFKKAHPDQVFPPPYMIYETFRLSYERYFISGRETAEWIRSHVAQYLPEKNISILDWGCGPGRVIRHLPQVFGPGNEYFGCDYNPSYVNWCSKNLPGITFRKNELAPPLPFGKEQMDLVYGLSIFTHLSEEKHHDWLAALLDVLKPGGILFITTHGDITRENLVPTELQTYDEGKLVVRSNVKEGHRMYVAYHPPAFMKGLFGNRVAILLHVPGKKESWGLQQDLWVLRKV